MATEAVRLHVAALAVERDVRGTVFVDARMPSRAADADAVLEGLVRQLGFEPLA